MGNGANSLGRKQLTNEDILRFIRRDKTAERTWQALQATSKWRNAEGIDAIADEDLGDIMPEGGEEFYFTGMDKDDRPVLVYRACAHTPGYHRVKLSENGRDCVAVPTLAVLRN